MVESTFKQWKKFMEGLRRGDVGPYSWNNCIDDVREYRNGEEVLAKITPNEFYINSEDLATCVHIYIPTDEEIDNWIEAGLDVGLEIANREGV